MSSRRRIVAAAAAGVALVLLDRVAVLASSGHLLFDVNPAEHGFLGAVIPWLSVPTWQLLSDPVTRKGFLHDCIGVGNQVHGTLGIAGLATVLAARLTDAPLSTGLIRGLALAQSTLALLLWCRALGAATRSARVVFAFCLLWALAPPTFLKISLLWWGTHDTVTLLASAWAALLLPWLARPARPPGMALRGAILGAAGGLLVLCNYALLLPVAGGLLFWSAAALLRAMCTLDGKRTAAALGASALSAVSLGLTVRAVLASGFFDGIGYPRSIQSEHYLMLSGKPGQPFLHRVSAGWLELDRWLAEVWPVAVRQAPSLSYGVHAASAEASVRIGVLVLGAGMVLRWLWSLRADREADRSGAWIGLYLPLAVAGIGTLSLSMSPDLRGGASPQLRYFAHLYPFAMAALALGLARRRWLAPLLLWPLWLGAFEHARLLDTDLIRDRLIDGYTYEGAPLYFRARPERQPPTGHAAWPGASADFIDGYAVLEGFQHRQYWEWLEPAALHDAAMIQDRLHRSIPDPRPQSDEYWRGVGAALRVLVPPARDELLDRVVWPFSAHRAEILSGHADRY